MVGDRVIICLCYCHTADAIAEDLRAGLDAAATLRAEVENVQAARRFLDLALDGVREDRERIMAGRLRARR